MDKLPKYWYIENKYQEVRDFLAKKYNRKNVECWITYSYIGYDDCGSDNGVHGCKESSFYHQESIVKLTIEEFREMTKKDEIINSYEIF